MLFVFLFDILQNLKCFLRCSRFHNNFLETSLQSTVFFNILTVFVESGCTDTLNFTTCQCWFQHIGGIHRARCRTGTHYIMNFIDKQNDIRILLQFVENCTDALFKLSAVFGSSHYSRHIECNHALIKQDT